MYINRATNQHDSRVNTISPSYALAYPSIPSMHSVWIPVIPFAGTLASTSDPFLNTARSQGTVKTGASEFKLAQSRSSLYLGGMDTPKYTGSIEYHPVTSQSYWQLANADILVGSPSLRYDQNPRAHHAVEYNPLLALSIPLDHPVWLHDRPPQQLLHHYSRLADVRCRERGLLVPVPLRPTSHSFLSAPSYN